MAFTYREIIENIADAEERLANAETEFEYQMAERELEELYAQRDLYDYGAEVDEEPLFQQPRYY